MGDVVLLIDVEDGVWIMLIGFIEVGVLLFVIGLRFIIR